jgi:hypothetical protein
MSSVILSFHEEQIEQQLTTHLNLIVHMYTQNFYILENFPFVVTIEAWNQKKI